MKKIFFVICFLIFGITETQAQFKMPTVYLQASFALPTGYMSDYYNLGLGADMQFMLPLKKGGFTKISLLGNTGYYTFGGKTRYDWLGNEVKADRIGYIPLHGGFRLDFSPDIVGAYVSYAYGITYIDGPTGGSRMGHDVNIGMWIQRVDLAIGFYRWTGSEGDKFKFVTFKIGWRLR